MTEKSKGHSLKKNKGEIVRITIIVLLCAAMAVLDFLPVTYTKNEVNNRLLSNTVPLMIGSVAVVWLMIRGKTKLFGKPTKPVVFNSLPFDRRGQFSLSRLFCG